MICEKCLKKEFKRYPKRLRRCVLDGNFQGAFANQVEMNFLEWVLSEDDCGGANGNKNS